MSRRGGSPWRGTETSGGSGGGTLRRVGDRGWGLKPHTALPQVQGGGGTETSGGRGGMLRRVGDYTASPGMQGGGSSPEALRTPPSSALCSAADAAVSDAHSEVGLQLDHRVRPLLPSGHHRPPFAKLSSHPSCSRAHPTRPSRLPGSCCDPTLPLPCDLMARPSGRYVLWLTFWCGCAAPGFMRTRASVDGPHGPGPPLSPPSKGRGRAGATPQALQVRQALSSW